MLIRSLRVVDSAPTAMRSICSSCRLFLDQKWRKQQGLPDNPNRNEVMRDLPDYRFVDGSPTPYGSRQRFRILNQRDYAAQILTLSKEMDYAVERHARLEEEKRKEIESILSRKLKKKGDKLLSE